jgi:hypothetical protein
MRELYLEKELREVKAIPRLLERVEKSKKIVVKEAIKTGDRGVSIGGTLVLPYEEILNLTNALYSTAGPNAFGYYTV